MKPYLLSSALVQKLQQAVQSTYAVDLLPEDIVIETPKQGQGDFATTVAFTLAKKLKQAPKNIGETLVASLNDNASFFTAAFAMPGFINFTIHPSLWQSMIDCVMQEDDDFFRPNLGQGKSVYLEYISANPTGPLHVGHARCAALGSFLANAMTEARYQVKQEYLINDKGLQIQTLALSVWLRHMQQTHDIRFPQKAYQGSYIQDIAEDLLVNKAMLPPIHLPHDCTRVADIQTALQAHHDPAHVQRLEALMASESDDDNLWLEALRVWYESCFAHTQRLAFEKACSASILSDIKNDCQAFHVSIPHWFSERTLHEQGKLEACMEKLKDHTYVKDNALWFASSRMGDSKDRVLQRSNGAFTYFAADIAYHLHKIEQKPNIIIDVFGADHHGYVARLTAAVRCLSAHAVDFSVLIYQFVSLFKNKQPLQMSTRSGTYVTLSDLTHEIGSGPARYFLLSKRPDMHVHFDLEEAKHASMDNPLYRIHYAHARCHSVLHKHPITHKVRNYQALDHANEIGILKTLAQYPSVLEKCIQERSAHTLSQFLFDLANQIHSYYAHTKIVQQDLEKDTQRLYLISSCQKILQKGLALLGIEALDRM